MKKICIMAIACIYAFFVVSCVSTPIDNKLMDPNLSRENHSVLSINQKIIGVIINGDYVKSGRSGTGSGTLLDTTLGTAEPIVVLTPGEHTLIAQYYSKDYQSSNQNSTTYSILSSGYISITYKFESGRYYYLKPLITGNRISLTVIDETDLKSSEAVKRKENAQKKVSKIKYPLNIAPSLTYSTIIENAINAEKTIFEGEWSYTKPYNVWDSDRGYYYTFIGKFYLFKYYYYGVSSIAFFKPIIELGTFEFNDNILTLNSLQKDERSSFGTTGNGILINLRKPDVTIYEYSINKDGELFLKSKKETLGPFKKSN